MKTVFRKNGKKERIKLLVKLAVTIRLVSLAKSTFIFYALLEKDGLQPYVQLS